MKENNRYKNPKAAIFGTHTNKFVAVFKSSWGSLAVIPPNALFLRRSSGMDACQGRNKEYF